MMIIFAAMKSEFCSLPKRLNTLKTKRFGFTTFEGNCGDAKVVLVKTGIGKIAAQSAAKKFIKYYSPRLVLSVGLAGAVIDDLTLGNLVVCKEVFQQGSPPIKSDIAYIHLALGLGNISLSETSSFTAKRAITTPEEKKDIARKYSVGIVEMESYLIAQEATRLFIPFLAIRVVSDTVNERIANFNHPLRIIYNPIEWWRVCRLFIKARHSLKSLDKFLLPFLVDITANTQ